MYKLKSHNIQNQNKIYPAGLLKNGYIKLYLEVKNGSYLGLRMGYGIEIFFLVGLFNS